MPTNEMIDEQVLIQNTDKTESQLKVEQWLAIRKEAGTRIDPETAEVKWVYAQILDPYGVYSDLPENLQLIGRAYFARSPESDIWVRLGDLPDHVYEALLKTHQSDVMFPAGHCEAIYPKSIDLCQ